MSKHRLPRRPGNRVTVHQLLSRDISDRTPEQVRAEKIAAALRAHQAVSA